MTGFVNVADYFERAAATVDPQVWCFFEGGADDERRGRRGDEGCEQRAETHQQSPD